MVQARKKPPGRQSHSPADKRIKQQIGANLRRARKALGLDQKGLADILGIAVSTLNKYEYGVSLPKPGHFVTLFEIGISIDYLFTGIGKPISAPVDINRLHHARKQAAGH